MTELRAIPGGRDAPASLENVEAEQAVLGVVLIDNGAMSALAKLLPEHFSDPVHARIFDLCRERINAGQLASPITLKGVMAGDEGLAVLGGPAYLVRLAAAAVSPGLVGHYASTVIEAWSRRRVSEIAGMMTAWTEVGTTGIADITAEVEAELLDVRAVTDRRTTNRSFLAASVASIQHISMLQQADGKAGTRTGLTALDEILGAMHGGRLIVMGGRPGMGKTTIGQTILTNVCRATDHEGRPQGGIFATLEMGAEELMARQWSRLLFEQGRKVPYFLIEQGKLSEEDHRALIETARDNTRFPMQIVDPDGMDVSDVISGIRQAAKAFSARCPLKLVVVDYLQLIQVRGVRTIFETPGRVMKAFKALARELGVPIIMLSQLSRDLERRDIKNRRPVPADLRNSGEIEEDAHAICFVYRYATYLEQQIKAMPDEVERQMLEEQLVHARNELEVIVAKNRSGPVGTAQLTVDLAHGIIRDRVNYADGDDARGFL